MKKQRAELENLQVTSLYRERWVVQESHLRNQGVKLKPCRGKVVKGLFELKAPCGLSMVGVGADITGL